MPMNLNHLRSFYYVIKLGSFSKAADKLFFSQPNISYQIHKLEDSIGLSLIDYHRKDLSVTPAGSRLFSFAEHLFEGESILQRDLDQIRTEIIGKLFITSSHIPGEFILPRILSQFKQQYPAIGIHISVSDPFKVFNDVQEGKFEIGFSSYMPDTMDGFKIAEDEAVLIVYPGHRLSSQKEASLEDLNNELFIVRTDISSGHSPADLLRQAGFDISQYNSTLVMGSNLGVVSAVEERAGIAFLSNLVIKKSESLGSVKVLKIKGLSLKRNFYCMYPKNKVFSGISSEFINFLKIYVNSVNNTISE
jgi:LysR family transcriptional regulator, transcriptional activator of the cysJI operon